MTVFQAFDDMSRSCEDTSVAFKSMVAELEASLKEQLKEKKQSYLLAALENMDQMSLDKLGLAVPKKLAFLQQLQSLDLVNTLKKFEVATLSRDTSSDYKIEPVSSSDTARAFSLEDPTTLSDESVKWRTAGLDLIAAGKVKFP